MAENADDHPASATESEVMIDGNTFKIHLLESLGDDAVAKKLQKIFAPSFERITQAVNDLVKTNQALRQQLLEKEAVINHLQQKCESLEDKIDDLEQWGRRGSMRIQGLPEEGSGQVEDKILALVNDDLSLEPPLELAEIEVAHRLPLPRRTALLRSQGQGPLPQVSAADHTDTTSPASSSADRGPRMVIVKFASRRVKSRVMGVRKELRNLDEEKYPRPIYFQDDLTARRGNIAYQARQGKKAGKLTDTWVIDSKVMVKDRNNRIHQVRTQKDIEHFTN